MSEQITKWIGVSQWQYPGINLQNGIGMGLEITSSKQLHLCLDVRISQSNEPGDASKVTKHLLWRLKMTYRWTFLCVYDKINISYNGKQNFKNEQYNESEIVHAF